jgi:hypothetical protein
MVEGIFHPSLKPPKIPPGWANQALFWISRLEQKTLSNLSMPFGSSLMIVGRKEDPALDPRV